jgi:hypothetical protein
MAMRAMLAGVFLTLSVGPAFAQHLEHSFEFEEVIGQHLEELGFDKIIRKRDVLIFGDRVVITQPLLTNGGNVIVYADELHLQAPIDTRIYIDFSKKKFIEEDCGLIPLFYRASETLGMNTTAYESYRLFYELTDEIWSDKSKSYELQRSLKRPEIPIYGHTSCVQKGDTGRTIVPPPEYNITKYRLFMDKVRSGSISFFVNKVSFCTDCFPSTAGWDGRKPEIPERSGVTPRAMLGC